MSRQGRPQKGAEPLTRRVTVKVTESQYERWAELADEYGASVSEWIRDGVDLLGNAEHIRREGVLLALRHRLEQDSGVGALARVRKLELKQAIDLINRAWPESRLMGPWPKPVRRK